jgi:hypothetical protein
MATSPTSAPVPKIRSSQVAVDDGGGGPCTDVLVTASAAFVVGVGVGASASRLAGGEGVGGVTAAAAGVARWVTLPAVPGCVGRGVETGAGQT